MVQLLGRDTDGCLHWSGQHRRAAGGLWYGLPGPGLLAAQTLRGREVGGGGVCEEQLQTKVRVDFTFSEKASLLRQH